MAGDRQPASQAIYVVDAFTERPFAGNPAGVCPLDEKRDAAWMQSVASEMNHAETAFPRSLPDGRFELRWFTPTCEIDICGHATLASAHLLWEEKLAPEGMPIRFVSAEHGELVAHREGGMIRLDFPAAPANAVAADPKLLAALGLKANEVTWTGQREQDALVILEATKTLRELTPDMGALKKLPLRGAFVSAPSDDEEHDFMSRVFVPAIGIDEDPVTGFAHCIFAPYWGARLGRQELKGYQASARGGSVSMKWDGRSKVELGGHAITTLRGHLEID